jgi:hypothetical protein
MKRTVLYITACAGLLLIVGCTEFLKENPRRDITRPTYFQNAGDALSSVNRLYRDGAQGRISGAGSAYVGSKASIDQMLTGYFWNTYEGQETHCMFARDLTRQANTQETCTRYSQDVWNACYDAIARANSAIAYIPPIEMNEADKARLIAEAKFFRAWNYFYLLKVFGEVPYMTEPTESLENVNVERSPLATIFTGIEADLTEAVSVLPAEKWAANGHRISKYVAAMLQANVLLFQGKYADAATAIRIVIQSGHSLTANTDLAAQSAFNKLRTTDDLDEVIWGYEYVGSIANSGWLPTYSLWPGGENVLEGTYSICHKVFGPKNRYLNVYIESDLRIQPNQFFHWTWTNPANGETISADVPQGEANGEAGVWYYLQEAALANGTGSADKDWNFYRYAEALLIGAEAVAQSTGVTAEAAGWLAQVKARADMGGKTVEAYTTELQALGKDAFVDEVLTERLREFPVEYKLWDDCLRTQRFPNISETVKGQVTWVPLVGAANGRGRIFKATDMRWPIPVLQIQRNPSLTQNEGYSAQ